jgi:general secretion pathway protein G
VRKIVLYLTILLCTFSVGVFSPKVFRLAKSQHQQHVRKSQESRLHDELFRLRALIRQYSVEQGSAPEALDDLVYAGYIREIPKDPITGDKFRGLVTVSYGFEHPCGVRSATVVSMSEEISTEGTLYNEW